LNLCERIERAANTALVSKRVTTGNLCERIESLSYRVREVTLRRAEVNLCERIESASRGGSSYTQAPPNLCERIESQRGAEVTTVKLEESLREN
jgi:hypothetical protein